MKKSKLRKTYLSKQLALSESERTKRSKQITEAFFSRFELENLDLLHLFLSIKEKGEVDTSFIFNELRENFPNIKMIVPRVDFEKDVLEHLEFNAETKLETNHWGIAEPVGEELINEKEIDMVLVPMLCFDKRGFRVGHGKGYYDKFLSKCRKDCLKIGLSLFAPVKEIEDVYVGDVRLDFCITPKETWQFDAETRTK